MGSAFGKRDSRLETGRNNLKPDLSLVGAGQSVSLVPSQKGRGGTAPGEAPHMSPAAAIHALGTFSCCLQGVVDNRSAHRALSSVSQRRPRASTGRARAARTPALPGQAAPPASASSAP